MTREALKKIVNTFKISCRGIDTYDKPVLSKRKSELVLVGIYEDGTSQVFCRYRDGRVKCDLDKECDDRDRGTCPYKLGR